MATKLILLFLLISHLSSGQIGIQTILSASTENFKTDSVNTSSNKIFNKRILLREINESDSKIDIRLYKLSSLSNNKSLRRIYLDKKSNWKAEAFDERKKPVVAIKKYRISPGCGFDSLIIKLVSFNILTLPPEDSIKPKIKKATGEVYEGQQLFSTLSVNDGERYTIEIKIGNKYRIYKFSNPDVYSKYYTDVNEFKDFLEIVHLFYSTLKPNSR